MAKQQKSEHVRMYFVSWMEDAQVRKAVLSLQPRTVRDLIERGYTVESAV